MDHKVFTASLPVSVLADLNSLEDGAGLRHLFCHVGLTIGLASWVALGGSLWWLALLPLGIALCFLFTLQHEATHKTPFATPWINDWVGHFCGLVLIQPFVWFRYFHLAHHRHTNDPQRDPELLSGAKPQGRLAMAFHLTGLPFWTGMIAQTVRNALGYNPGDYVPLRARKRVRVEARIMLVIYVIACASLFFMPLLFWIWILPCLLGQPILRLYLLAEHGRCAFVEDMFLNTRTTLTNRLVRFLAWNMPYHVEHHSLPQVPFHKLPELHSHMKGQHQVLSDGYSSFTREYLKTLT